MPEGYETAQPQLALQQRHNDSRLMRDEIRFQLFGMGIRAPESKAVVRDYLPTRGSGKTCREATPEFHRAKAVVEQQYRRQIAF